MDEEHILDLNFWPSFADLMLALVLILLLVLFMITMVIAAGTVIPAEVEQHQMSMITAIASAYGVDPDTLRRDPSGRVVEFGISTANKGSRDVRIRNGFELQQITFSDHILFPQDEFELNARGCRILRIVGAALKKQLPSIREIQIQGHADTDPTRRFPSNLDLAALRAIQVFKFLQDSVGIDPAEHLMSATSFGEFKPVQRIEPEARYNRQRLFADNKTDALKNQNRRIELLLFYDSSSRDSGGAKQGISRDR